jgi:hypothetical protein
VIGYVDPIYLGIKRYEYKNRGMLDNVPAFENFLKRSPT